MEDVLLTCSGLESHAPSGPQFHLGGDLRAAAPTAETPLTLKMVTLLLPQLKPAFSGDARSRRPQASSELRKDLEGDRSPCFLSRGSTCRKDVSSLICPLRAEYKEMSGLYF